MCDSIEVLSSGLFFFATNGHTLFLNAPCTEHDCREVCFRRNSSLLKIPYESLPSEGCVSRNVARR
jgi:hypothetical protein